MSAPESSSAPAPRSIKATLRRIAMVYHDPAGEVQQAAQKLVNIVLAEIEKSSPGKWGMASNNQLMVLEVLVNDEAWCPATILSDARTKAYPIAVQKLLEVEGIHHVSGDAKGVQVFVPNVKGDARLAAQALRPPIVKVEPGFLCVRCKKEPATESTCDHFLLCMACDAKKDQVTCCKVCGY